MFKQTTERKYANCRLKGIHKREHDMGKERIILYSKGKMKGIVQFRRTWQGIINGKMQYTVKGDDRFKIFYLCHHKGARLKSNLTLDGDKPQS